MFSACLQTLSSTITPRLDTTRFFMALNTKLSPSPPTTSSLPAPFVALHAPHRLWFLVPMSACLDGGRSTLVTWWPAIMLIPLRASMFASIPVSGIYPGRRRTTTAGVCITLCQSAVVWPVPLTRIERSFFVLFALSEILTDWQIPPMGGTIFCRSERIFGFPWVRSFSSEEKLKFDATDLYQTEREREREREREKKGTWDINVLRICTFLLFYFVLFFMCAVWTGKQSGRIEERKRRIANEEWEALRASSSKVKSNQSRLKSVRVEPSQVESTQFKSSKVGFVKYSQVRSGQVKSSKFRSGQVRSGQVKSSKFRSGQVRLGQVKSSRVYSGQDRLDQVESSRVNSGQDRLGQVKSSKFRSVQVRSGQVK